MAARLTATSADGSAGRQLLLTSGRTTVGRAAGNSLVLDDREVSKYHAEIIGDDSGYTVCDLGSSNGTYVNGERISKQRLRDGDVVEFGGHRFAFADEAARATPGEHAAVTILPQSPIDRTTVLASSRLKALVPVTQVRDAQDLRTMYERVRVAFAAVQELLQTTDIRKLCGHILDVAFQLLKAESGAVLLFDAHGQLAPLTHRWGSGVKTAADARIMVSRTIVDQVVRERAAVLATDALTDVRFGTAHSVVMSGMRSVMCVPLMNGEQIFGILHVGNSKEVAAFAATDLELISGIGAGAGVALSNAFMAHRLAEESRTRESLGRFLSPVVVEQVMQRGIDLKRGGEERELTVMFADIRGFTSLTERSKAQDIVAWLNEYFDQMVEVVFRHSGILDKFIGDALMAVWGTPIAHGDDATRALAAAREMLSTLHSLNALRRDRQLEAFEIGIGLASGRCVAGAMGARRRLEYTVIGDAVNLASRLAGIAKPGQIICDEATFRRAGKPNDARSLPPAQVKGKTKPVPIYEVPG